MSCFSPCQVVILAGTLLLASQNSAAASPAVAEKPASSQQPNDLPGFRTVKNAITSKLGARGTSSSLQPAWLGAAFVGEKDLTIEEVADNSPAAKAKLQAGDKLVEFNSEPVERPFDVQQLLQSQAPGDKCQLTILRDGKSQELAVTLAAVSRPLSSSGSSQRGVLGVRVQQSANPKGSRIEYVVARSAAAKGGLKRGDIITKVADKVVADYSSLSAVLQGTRPGQELQLVLQRASEEIEVTVELGSQSQQPTRSRTPSTRTGEYRLAIIPVEYPDQKHNPKITAEAWHESLFTEGTFRDRNATGQRVFGSLNDYYRELSCGKFGVEGKVFDWIEVEKPRQDYLQGSKSGLLVEALDKLLERDGDDALDGFDGIFFLYAGGRVRTSRGALYWPHRATVTHRRKRWPYFIIQEGGNRMTGISVMCHEFGHMLGLPDLYSTDSRTEGLSVWCAMSNQAGNGRPQHFSAWCKERLGWLKPAVIDPTVKQKLVLGPVENSTTECYKVLIQPDGSEYLLLENRRRIRFDASLPSDGLLIWRVVNGRPLLEESHGIGGPRGPSSYRDAVPYPSRANQSFTPATTPSSKSVLGGGLPVHITNIRELPDGRVTFYVGYEFQ